MTILLGVYIWAAHKAGRADELPIEVAWAFSLILDWALAMMAIAIFGAA